MKNILLKLIYVFTLTLGINTATQAQLVYIPDPNFRAYLNQNFASCMVGNSIDPTCPAVLAVTNLNVAGLGIANLTGIHVFSNCSYLYCSSNSLTSLPTLPSPLYTLDCSHNQITYLPAITAVEIHCEYNQLSNLDLTSGINWSLRELICNNNQLTSLNLPIGSNMLLVDCSYNLLTALYTSATGIEYLYCQNNLLTTLTAIATYRLNCSNNLLTSLPPLQNTLNEIDCNNNQLSSLPTLPPSLNYLTCYNNQLTSLPALPSSLNWLDCRNNPLTCLPDLKQVQTLNFSGTLINCTPSYGIVSWGNPVLSTLPLCDEFNSNGCDFYWNINGTTFLDADSNCIKGTNETKIRNQKINLYKNGVKDQQTYTKLNGDYDFITTSFDIYKTQLDTTNSILDIFCPSSGFYLDSVSTLDSLKQNRNFGMRCNGIDLSVSSIVTLGLRPASVREIKISAGEYSNYFGAQCASGISGTVNISITGSCNYISPGLGALTPNSIIGNVLTYNIADFGAVNYDSSFNFIILVDTSAILGSHICIQVSISTPSAEINYNNNLLSQCFRVFGSFDPNDKSTYPDSTLDISGDRWLTYLIRFQNTGTADAEHIIITDTLSASLDWSTFNLLSFSHQPLTQVYNDGLVKFSFANIHLPDSNTNEPASHGYVQYKIRAKDSLAIGSSIENTANIFFDFNAPVITNTTSNTIINCAIPPTTISATICQGEMFILNSAVYLSPGTFYQSLLTSQGCDSTVVLNLTILPRSQNYITNSICDGTSINFNGQILDTAGVFKDTLVNSIGCDSIVYLTLSLLPKSTFQFSEQICQGSSYNFNGQILNLTGNYSDTLINYLGCDSIINLNLQANPSYLTLQSVTTCDFDSFPFDGNLLTQSGTYYDSLLTINGCDSIIELQLNVTGITNIITQTSNTLQTQATGSAYVWINCATNQFIFGVSGPSFQPFQSGDYAVAVTYGNCIDTSACFSFSMVGLPTSIAADVIFQTRYNINADHIQLHAEKLKGNKGVLRLMDISGRIIFQKQIENIAAGNLDIEIPAKGMNSGIYLVNLITERDNVSGKVVKY